MKKPDSQTVSYRQCFTSDAGRWTLGDILINGGYFDTDLKTEGEIAVQNFVKRIVKKLGICSTPESISEYINKLFELKAE